MSDLRRRILKVAAETGDGHVASAFSILDILQVLYRGHSPDDIVVLSKGHSSLALYAVLEQEGVIPTMAGLPGHPEIGIPGVACSTGSLGHGLPMAAGMAYALRLKGSPAQVWCIVGDTEMEEGSCWEAIHMAARLGLGNLNLIVDNNGNSPNAIDGTPFESGLANKLLAFGWHVSIVDGHDAEDLKRMLVPLHADAPQAIVANTVKGKGIARMEAEPQAWHRRAPTALEMSEMVAELGSAAGRA